MKHVNKKGFTLVELLSIIIILGIIALITVPVVANIMKDMKKKSFKSSVNGLVESSKMYYSKKVNDSDFEGNVFSFGKDEKLDGLEIKGKHPIDGEILLNVDGEIKLYVTDGEFCAFKSFDSNIITITENLDCINKSETPIISVVSNKSTTNRISVVANCSYDSGNEIEIEKYEFSKDGGKTWDSRKVDNKALNYYTYSNLKQDEDYEFVARCITKVGTSAQKTIDVNLVDIDKTLIDVPNGWAKEKEVTISYPKGRYVYQYQELDSNDDVIDEDKWITVEKTESGSTHNIYQKTYIENKYIITRVLDDGGNYVDSDSILINKIDRTAPAVPTLTNSSGGNWTNQDVTITTSSTDTASGVKQIYYSYDNSNWSESWSANSSTAITNGIQIKDTWKSSTTYNKTLYLRACDNVGNCSSSSNTKILIDKVAPSVPSITSSSEGKWTNQDVTITTSSTDTASGVKQIYYSYDNSNWSESWSANSSTAITNGIQIKDTWKSSTTYNKTLYLRACDNVGNCSSSSNTKILIDKVAPSTPTITNSSGGNWTNVSIIITAQATDTGSGISKFQWGYDDTPWYNWTTGTTSSITNGKKIEDKWVDEINKKLWIRAIDEAGNASTSVTTMLKLDRTAPTMSWSHSSGTLTSGTTVTVSCSDGHSGMSSTSMTDMGYTTTGTSSASQSLSSKRCSKATTATCTDAAGNTTSGSMTYSVYHTCSRTAYSYKGSYCGTTCTSAGGTQVNDSYCGGGSCCCRFANGLEKYSCCS